MPSERAVMFVEPAGTIPSADRVPRIPVATSATVPSPPTATTTSAQRVASRAVAVASGEDSTTRISRSALLESRLPSDSDMAVTPCRLAELTIAQRRDVVRPVRSLRARSALSGTFGGVFGAEQNFGDVVREPRGSRDEHEPEDAADRISQHDIPPGLLRRIVRPANSNGQGAKISRAACLTTPIGRGAVCR